MRILLAILAQVFFLVIAVIGAIIDKLKHMILLLLLCSCLVGCIKAPFIVQEKDKIYTIKSGSEVLVYYDNKPIKKIFESDMFVVNKDILIADASNAIDGMIKKIGMEGRVKRTMAIVGSVLGVLAMGLAIFIKTKGIKFNFTGKN